MAGDVDALPPWWRRPRTWAFQLTSAAIVALLLTGLAAAGFAAGVLEQQRRSSLDRFFPHGRTSDGIVVVEIDQAGVQAHGWPWPRSLHADLIDRIADAGAAVIVYDVVFDLPTEHDAELAAAIERSGNVVLASSAGLEPRTGQAVWEVVEPRADPVPALATAAAEVAIAASRDERDGVVRSVPAFVRVPGGDGNAADDLRPGLAFAAIGHLFDENRGIPIFRPQGVQYGTELFPAPVEAAYHVDLTWTEELRWDTERRRAVQALDVLAGDVGASVFEGRVVLVGTTDPLLKDFVRTPVAPDLGGEPGVYVHAQAINSLLTGQYRPPIDDRLALATVGVLAAVVTVLSLRLRLWTVPLTVAAALGLNLLWAAQRFDAGAATDVVYPSIAVVAAAVAAIALRYVTELRERRRVEALFGQYVPPSVAETLIASGRVRAATEGERLEVTVFFCDLRGFTRAAAGLEPREVRSLLNAYYEHVTAVVLEHGGTVMQYVGDEVFAVFGAPVARSDHAQRALDCAVAVRDSIAALSDSLLARGLPPVAFGIGLNSGPVVAAHVGTFHKQYAVIGDTVNVGSRFCALAKAHQIALPGSLRDRLTEEPPLIAVGPVQMKGVDRDLAVFKVGRTSDDTPLEAYAQNLTAGPDEPKAVELGPEA